VATWVFLREIYLQEFFNRFATESWWWANIYSCRWAEQMHSPVDWMCGWRPAAYAIIRFLKWNHPSSSYYRSFFLPCERQGGATYRSWKKHGNVLEASIALISSSTSLTLFLLLLPSVPPHSTRHRFIECRVNHPSQPPPPSECARFQSITNNNILENKKISEAYS
jgi:hypothetical protein